MPNKIDSNITGLSYAEEETIKNLPVTPIWYPLEPNSYSDFGGQISTVARNPINASRQRKKGVTTDLEASGGFNQDLTQTNLTRLLQGFVFADMREKGTNASLSAAYIGVAVTAIDDTYTFASGTVGDNFAANDLLLASGFGEAANNGLKTVVSSTSTTVVVGDGLVDESAPTDAKVERVGFQFADGDAGIDASGTFPRLTATAKDLTTLGLIVGEWVFIGGDTAATAFDTAENNGFARVRAVAAGYIEFDKTASTMATEAAAAGKTIRLFVGNVLKNESDPALIKRRTYQLERTLGQDANGTQSEYLVGAVPSEVSIQIRQADKVTMDLSFVATDNEQRDGAAGVKSGTRKTNTTETAFNTSSDFSRIKMHQVSASDSNPNPLFAFLTELSLTVNNNVQPNKAVAVLGAFDVSAGTFAVSGSITAYFAEVAAVQAVRNNADVSLDFALVKNNAGLLVDLPLIALGEGRLNVEQDQPITLPLSVDAAEGTAGHTFLLNDFPYLPTLADS